MKIAAAYTPAFGHAKKKLLVSDDAPSVAPDQAKGLVKALGIVAAKNLSATTVAGVSWKLTTVPTVTSQPDLATMLVNNNVAPDKAPQFAQEIRQLLGNPVVRSVLIAVSGGAVAYLVVEKTSWSRTAKWSVIVGFAVLCGVAYALLRHYKILV